ncbi:hypothetical protein [Zobellia nedashkovskayae]|uniref:hypothetical protein n=1 Tax=Zobellia nedashkovskayae TaxID=2779510 RepID=UPI00188D4D96|nr:hypothetical protein [Zobellia nedashkovskayae]
MIYISNRLSSYYLRIILIFLIFSFKATLAQETGLDQKVTTIQELLSSVEANKLTFDQEFKTVSPGYYDYTISEINSKGNEESTTYSFALADIDKNSVRYFTKKDVILVELAVKGKQKLIKKLSDEGGKIAYITSFTMYGLNADNGRDLESAIENSIPEAIEVNKNLLVLDSYKDHLQWLEKNIGNVDLPKHQITQQLSKDLEKSGVVVLNQTVDSKNERFEFNLSLLNPNSVNYKISGDEFLIEVGSAKGVSGITFYSDEVLKGYTDKVFFYANSLANGKNIYKVLKEIIPLATTEFDTSKPDFNTVNSALDYLNNHIDDIQSDGRTTAQKLTLEDYMATFSLKETISDKNEEHLYSFNLTDINQNKISFNDKKTRFYLVLNTNKEEKYIGHSFNGETENYEKEILLYFNSYDEAYVSKEALQFLVVHFKDQITETNESFEIGLEDALSQLSSEIKPVQADNLRYEQEIELLETETSTFKFTQTESSDKKTTEYVYEFSAKDLSQKSSKVIVSGKRVWAEIGVKSEQKLVKVYKDGQVQNYENKIEIEALNPENAKEIVAILKRLAASKSKL